MRLEAPKGGAAVDFALIDVAHHGIDLHLHLFAETQMIRRGADGKGCSAAMLPRILSNEMTALDQAQNLVVQGVEFGQLARPQLFRPILDEGVQTISAGIGAIRRQQGFGIVLRHIDAAHLQRRFGHVTVEPFAVESIIRRMTVVVDGAVVVRHGAETEAGNNGGEDSKGCD